jgi:hypothetical protein
MSRRHTAHLHALLRIATWADDEANEVIPRVLVDGDVDLAAELAWPAEGHNTLSAPEDRLYQIESTEWITSVAVGQMSHANSCVLAKTASSMCQWCPRQQLRPHAASVCANACQLCISSNHARPTP